MRFSWVGVIVAFVISLSGCASSNVSREAATNVDQGMENASQLVGGAAQTDIAETYQNASQTAKGALIGGMAGALTGWLASGVGTVPGTAVGIILGASYGAYIDANTTLEDQLENRGATIVVLGDHILVMVPSARLFYGRTPEIKPQAYSTLRLISAYINRYTKMLVKVAAYTNCSGSDSVDLSLSDQQANQVAKMLLASGTDARVLYAAGYGGRSLVTRNNLEWDDNDNYRIEITLQKLPG